jgi:hypothetical protein
VKSAAGEKQPLVARLQLSCIRVSSWQEKTLSFITEMMRAEREDGGCNAKPTTTHPPRLIFSISAPVTLEKKTEPP